MLRNPRSINLSDAEWMPGEKSVVKGVQAAASSDNAVVTYTMLKTLSEGGNAIDAGIAGALVQTALEPFMTNLTGTVIALYYHAGEAKFYQLDSSGIFPSDLPAHMPVPQGMGPYAQVPPRSVIPGFMPGMTALHGRFGSKAWQELCEEAVWWAEEGHHVSSFEYEVNLFGENFISFFPEGRKFYMPQGLLPRVGEKFASREMAQTLKKVAEEGPDYMINGEWADAFIQKGNELGWKITREHMRETAPRWIEPLRFWVGDHEIVSLAPPGQQGIFIALVLGILQKLGIESVRPYGADHLFSMAHALKMAGMLCGYQNDPEILSFDVNTFLDPSLHAHLAKLIEGMRPRVDLSEHVKKTINFGAQGGKIPTTSRDSHQSQPSGSCELSVVDKHGNWLQMMNTLQSGGIPGQVVGGVPMVGSHAQPNRHDQTIVYFQVKGARLRHPIGNTMVLKDGKPVLQLGTPGNVYCTVPQVLCNHLYFGMDPYQAVRAPRMLGLQEGGTFVIEDRIPESVQNELMKLGLRMQVSRAWDLHMGSFQVCYLDPQTGELCTLADPRRCGVADGIK
jgi:gamma-glutamyltranspeptidase / glutathione hydrolase